MDKIILLHPKLRIEAYEIQKVINERVQGCIFTHTLRTIKEQDELFAIGRTKPGKIVTNARGGSSFHNYGLAIDIAFNRDGKLSYDMKSDNDKDGKADWMEVVQTFHEFGWEWGGNWKFVDYPHFQKTFGFSVRELAALRKDIQGYPII